jgi:ATPase
LLGVTHANSALEAIQRLIGKVDLGLVSQVLDTVIHVEKGEIAQVLELRMTVKAPSGMQEELARPVIEIVQFPDGRVTHEMFAFGSEIAVVPVGGKKGNTAPIFELAREQLATKIRDSVGVKCGVRITSDRSAEIYVPAGMISVLIGKGGENVRSLENELGGVKLRISSFEDMPSDVEVVEERGFQIHDHMGNDNHGGDNRGWDNSKKARRRNRKR